MWKDDYHMEYSWTVQKSIDITILNSFHMVSVFSLYEKPLVRWRVSICSPFNISILLIYIVA